MGNCFTRLRAEMVAPPHAYNGDPFAPRRPMSRIPKNLARSQARSSPPANPSAPPPTSMQSSVDARRTINNTTTLTNGTVLTNPDYSGREGRASLNRRGRQASGVSPHGTRWGDEKSPNGGPDVRNYSRSPYRSGQANENGDSKWFDYGCDDGNCTPIRRTETGTTIPGLSYDQAGRPVWRGPNKVARNYA